MDCPTTPAYVWAVIGAVLRAVVWSIVGTVIWIPGLHLLYKMFGFVVYSFMKKKNLKKFL